jgi:hypothetical protein
LQPWEDKAACCGQRLGRIQEPGKVKG